MHSRVSVRCFRTGIAGVRTSLKNARAHEHCLPRVWHVPYPSPLQCSTSFASATRQSAPFPPRSPWRDVLGAARTTELLARVTELAAPLFSRRAPPLKPT